MRIFCAKNQKKQSEKPGISNFETARPDTQILKKTSRGLVQGLKTIRNFVRSAIDRAYNKTLLFLRIAYPFRVA